MQLGWRMYQASIMFAVNGTNIIWHWAPSPSYLCPFCALAAAAIGTDLAWRGLQLIRRLGRREHAHHAVD